MNDGIYTVTKGVQTLSELNLVKTKLSFLLCPQEGILQRLQSSVEQEESRWRVKVELSQGELRDVCVHVYPKTKPRYFIASCVLFIEPFFNILTFLDEPESHSSGARD